MQLQQSTYPHTRPIIAQAIEVLLRRRDLTQTEIRKILNVSTVSHDIAWLLQQGLIACRPGRPKKYYALRK